MIKSVLTLVCCFILILNAFAQQQNPSDLKWSQIKTAHFKIIFPTEIANQANRTIQTLEFIRQQDMQNLTVKPKKVPIVLLNQSVISNGYATLFPRKLAYYCTPPQNALIVSSTNWITTLSIHEYRHIIQYDANNRHLTKLAGIFMGAIGKITFQYSIPDWWYEGDAVYMETILTKGGRGRTPEFDMSLRAILLSNQNYGYDKALLNSYKHYLPNHYLYGYMQVTHARLHYGAEIWDKTLNRTTKYSFWPFAFSRSLKKYTKTNLRTNYLHTMSHLKDLYTKQSATVSETGFTNVTTQKRRSYTNYTNPMLCGKRMVYIKSGMDDASAFYAIDSVGNEVKLLATEADYASANDSVICFTETISDIRWGEKSYSDIFIYNLNNKKVNRITEKQKLFSPYISPDGKTIVAVQYPANGNCNIVIYNIEKQMVTDTIPNFANEFIRYPALNSNKNKIVYTTTNDNGNTLKIYNIDTKITSTLIAETDENISRPVFADSLILYNSEISGISNIYAIGINTGKRYQVTSVKYGAFNPAFEPINNEIYFQNYTPDGYNIVKAQLNEHNFTPLDKVIINPLHYFAPLVLPQNEQLSEQLKTLRDTSYTITKYNKLIDAVKIHSWAVLPTYEGGDFAIMSENLLQTFSFTTGAMYQNSSRFFNGYTSVSFAKYFPIFNISSNYGMRSAVYTIKNPDNTLSNTTDIWNETNLNTEIIIPLNFSKGPNYTTLNLTVGYQIKNIKNKDYRYYFSEVGNGVFSSMYTSLSFYNQKYGTKRSILPRNGQSFDIQYTKSLPGAEMKGEQFMHMPVYICQDCITIIA